MQHFPKAKVTVLVVVPSLIFFVFILLMTTKTITNVSAVETEGIGVYWDSDCTDRVSSIDWGTLTPGSLKNIVVYIQNEVDEPQFLSMSIMNWKPSKAYHYIVLKRDYNGPLIDPSEVLKITLTLSVSRYIEGISSFSFDILVAGSDSLWGDVNNDGAVNTADVMIVIRIYSNIPGWEIWTTKADVNGDSVVDTADVMIVIRIYSGIIL